MQRASPDPGPRPLGDVPVHATLFAASRALCHAPADPKLHGAECRPQARGGSRTRGGDPMSQPSRTKLVRLAGAVALGASLLLPSAAPAAAADPVILTVGTTQDLDASNPFNTALVSGYEAFQLTYNLLTEFDKDAKPAPGYADSWQRAPDKVTFHVRDGMKFSDGTPATSKDVCFSWGLAMAAIKDGANIGAGYLDPNVKDAGVTKIECPDP